MAGKRDSEASRQKILKVAEKLFAEQGFDGARMDEIARQAGVNKALIYYYFKSKDDVLNALFTSAMEDISDVIQHTFEDFKLEEQEAEEIFNLMVNLISQKKQIIKIMMMESLKASDRYPPIFKIANYFMAGEVETLIELFRQREPKFNITADKNQMLVTEFFTGMMPLITFVIFQDEWCKDFKMDPKDLKNYFYQSFKLTHFAYHTNMLKE